MLAQKQQKSPIPCGEGQRSLAARLDSAVKLVAHAAWPPEVEQRERGHQSAPCTSTTSTQPASTPSSGMAARPRDSSSGMSWRSKGCAASGTEEDRSGIHTASCNPSVQPSRRMRRSTELTSVSAARERKRENNGIELRWSLRLPRTTSSGPPRRTRLIKGDAAGEVSSGRVPHTTSAVSCSTAGRSEPKGAAPRTKLVAPPASE